MRTHDSSRRTRIRSLCLSRRGSIFGLHVAIAQTSGICRTVLARRVISGDRQINATSNCNVRRYASAQIIIGLLIITGLASQLSAQSYTIWPSTATPAIADGGPDKAVELGVKFRADVTGTITGVRFYKSATNTGTHTAHLWSGSGTSLATATFSGETASGWQQVNFTTPVAITANTVYVASYHSTSGHYSDDENYFSTGVDRAPLHALADGVSGVNGAYAYGSASKFPNLSFNSSNYWVDVVFTPSGGDTTAPTVTTFTIPSTANTLTVPISSFTATDNVGVTGYMVNESATTPSAAAAGWSATAPASYTFASAGSKTLYSWAKDAAGNISTSRSGSVVITILDTTAPTVTGFSIPGTSTSLTVAITTFTATDNVGVTGYMVNESTTTPSAAAGGWSASPPASYTFATAGSKTLYSWAKDAAGNVSASRSASVTITLDTTAPTVTTFSIPTTATSLTISITSFTATDNISVAGYMANESSTTPSATAAGWSASAPASYTFTSAGSKILYAWAKDAAGNVSSSRSAQVTITLSSGGPEPTGWFAGDIHVHRSCGGSPEAVSSLYSKMSTNNLAAISLLADMGNGEVQNPTTDLPLVNGSDASASTPGRIVHWDTEWHWDATYTQYPHQALGGHIVALGLSSAQQVWQEYTFPILDWAHQRGGIAGFAHMQYLDGSFPTSLTCCTPVEYPVEVALGAADFISEDVDDVGSGFSMNPEAAVQAYYKLLNSGLRPGFAAGTDYPCNSSRPLGAVLTYVQTASGQMTYRNWIAGIKNGRTVVSRNGHNEFLSLVVNGTATPGDEIDLATPGSVSVTIQWTATQNLTGTIELVNNGVVVASQSASAAPGAPATWTGTVNLSKSGWLAARRMGTDGHQVHTAAVFVIVNGAPIRASAGDAQYFVDWINGLLSNTSVGGVWNHYFPTSLNAAQARYQAAKTYYQGVLADASSGGTTSGSTIFTTQVPSAFENDGTYELGTRFYADVNGQITQVRLYTSAQEGGSHNVRIWRVTDGALMAGPYTWSTTSGAEGWQNFVLPTALNITANTDYVVAISTSSDRWYAEDVQGFSAAISTGHLHTYVGSGVFTPSLGTMPSSTWQNSNYFRDVVFAAQ